MKIRSLLMLVSMFVLGSCNDATSPAPTIALPTQMNLNPGPCAQGSGPTSEIGGGAIPCGDLVHVSLSGVHTDFHQGIMDAVETWNRILDKAEAGVPGLPRFTFGAGTWTLPINIEGSSTQYCGQGETQVVNIYPIGDSRCADYHAKGVSVENFNTLMVHELGHVVGFHHMKLPLKDILLACTMSVRENADLVGTPCDYEEQSLYASYGLRGAAPPLLEFIDYVGVTPSSHTMLPGQSVTLTSQIAVDWAVAGSGATLVNETATSVLVQTQATTAPGVITVTARAESAPEVAWPNPVTDVAITIAGPAVDSLKVKPGKVTTTVGTTKRLTAWAYTAPPRTRIITAPIVWTVSDTNILEIVSVNGKTTVDIRTKAAGKATVTGTAQSGLTSSSTFTVIDNITVTPASASILVDETQQFTATAYANGVVMSGVSFTWLAPSYAQVVSTPTVRTAVIQGIGGGVGGSVVASAGGLSKAVPLTVTVPPPNVPPVAAFSDSCIGGACQFLNQSYDADGYISRIRFDFGDGTSSTAGSIVHDYTQSGEYPVRLTAWDNQNDSSSVTRTVNVTVTFGAFLVEPQTAPRNFHFRAENAGAQSYAWNFGDGTTGSGQGIYHTFATCPPNGQRTVTLTETRNGIAYSQSKVVQVCIGTE